MENSTIDWKIQIDNTYRLINVMNILGLTVDVTIYFTFYIFIYFNIVCFEMFVHCTPIPVLFAANQLAISFFAIYIFYYNILNYHIFMLNSKRGKWAEKPIKTVIKMIIIPLILYFMLFLAGSFFGLFYHHLQPFAIHRWMKYSPTRFHSD